jgi:hypothetical protein
MNLTDKAIGFTRITARGTTLEFFTDANPATVQSVWDLLKLGDHTFASGTFSGVRCKIGHLFKVCDVNNYLNDHSTRILGHSPAAADNEIFGKTHDFAVTVGATATLLSAAGFREAIMVQNNGSVDMYIGYSPNVTTTTGTKVSASGGVYRNDGSMEALYGIVVSSTTNARVEEIFR